MITLEIVKLNVQQYLELMIVRSDVVDLEDLLLIPTVGRK